MRVRALALLVALAAPGVADAAEITVLCARDMQHLVAAAADEFQRAAGHQVWLSYGTADGVVQRARTEAADVVIGRAAAVTELEREGAIRAGATIVLGRVAVGVGVRAGMRAPDITSSAKLRRAILLATSLGYVDPNRDAVGRHVGDVLDGIGIAPLVGLKTTLFPDGPRALAALVRGEIALVLGAVSEIRAVEGVVLAGPLPAPHQSTHVYTAAVLTRSPAADAARAFLEHLASADVRTRFAAGGVESAER